MSEKTCPECGKRFTSWRGKKYCSEEHRKRAENRRLRGDESEKQAIIPEGEKTGKIHQQNQSLSEDVRGDESPSFIVSHSDWLACNEITDKFQYKGTAIGWAMQVELTFDYLPPDPKQSKQIIKTGWFGRVGKEMSFGPTTRTRARASVEAYLLGEPFAKHDGEQSWRGDSWKLVDRTGYRLADSQITGRTTTSA